MNANFDTRLNLKNDRRTVTANGPVHWDRGDEWAEIKDVVVDQAQANIAGSSNGSTTVRKDRDHHWWLDVSSSDQFTPGKAQVRAVAIVYTTDGTSRKQPWAQDVQLV